ncbi:hypothetical protein D8S78_10095 [Natrialba swarupiae]|nr:hypothetical protein [Natrialba swarupiae]
MPTGVRQLSPLSPSRADYHRCLRLEPTITAVSISADRHRCRCRPFTDVERSYCRRVSCGDSTTRSPS